MGKTRFKVGDKVKVSIAPFDLYRTAQSVRTYNGKTAVVSKVMTTIRGAAEDYYELEGITSKYGIPFNFCGDWLVKA